jgi:hypothetical protein
MCLWQTFEEGHNIAKYVNEEPPSYIKSRLAQLGTSLVLKMLLVKTISKIVISMIDHSMLAIYMHLLVKLLNVV